jgi:5,10-methylenetetrahydromethanopterin reductase
MSRRREVWVSQYFDHVSIAADAVRREAQGYDGISVGESQNRYGDPFSALVLAGAATSRLKLATSATNPATRHPAVMAAAIESVQTASGGRAVLGIGAGDSALASLGIAPAPLATLRRYVLALRTYLQGGEVDMDTSQAFFPMVESNLRKYSDLGIGPGLASSRLQWLPADLDPVPVRVWATGPKTIDMGATCADEVSFSVGADPARIKWAVERARAARVAAGGDPDQLELGASIHVGLHEDIGEARRLIAGILSSSARFAVMGTGAPAGPLAPGAAEVMQNARKNYDVSHHAHQGSKQAAELTDEFIDYYGIVGSADRCAERLNELFELGLTQVKVNLSSKDSAPEAIEECYARFAAEVIPLLR